MLLLDGAADIFSALPKTESEIAVVTHKNAVTWRIEE
jgi:hypothetical protein